MSSPLKHLLLIAESEGTTQRGWSSSIVATNEQHYTSTSTTTTGTTRYNNNNTTDDYQPTSITILVRPEHLDPDLDDGLIPNDDDHDDDDDNNIMHNNNDHDEYLRNYTNSTTISSSKICTVCNKSFSRAWSLQRHMTDRHYYVPQHLECDICGRSYRSRNSLISHKSQYHGAGVSSKIKDQKLNFHKF